MKAIKGPYRALRIFWDVTSGTELINYDPLAIAAIDHRHNSILAKITNFTLDWLPYIVGIIFFVQVIIPEI